MFRVKLAESAAERDSAYRMRYQVLVEEDGRDFPAVNGRLFDRFDGLPGVANLIAVHEGRVVGTTRVMADLSVGTAPDEHIQFKPLLPESASSTAARVGAASWLTIARESRSVPRLSLALMAMALRWCLEEGLTHLKIVANPEVGKLFENMGFRRLGGQLRSETVAVEVMAMLLDFGDLRGRCGVLVRRHQLQHPLSSFERQFHGAGEAIATRPGEVLVVVHGSVIVRDAEQRVTARRGIGDLLLAPGPTFVAESDVDLMVVSGASFEQQIAARPSIALRLLSSIAKHGGPEVMPAAPTSPSREKESATGAYGNRSCQAGVGTGLT